MEIMMMAGAPVAHNAFGSAEQAIKAAFSKFIMTAEMDSLGFLRVLTQAAIDRASGAAKSARRRQKEQCQTNQLL
jgi:hypothetical protein